MKEDVEDEEIVARANANLSLMDGTIDPVKKIIAGAELVFAVWPDDSKPEGCDYMVIKGVRRLEAIAAAGTPQPGVAPLFASGGVMTWDAIIVECCEHAVAVQRVLIPGG